MKHCFILTSILVLAVLEANRVTCNDPVTGDPVTKDPVTIGGQADQQVTQANAPHAPLQAAAKGTDASPSTSALSTREQVTTVPPTTTTQAPSFDEIEEKKFCGHINYTEIASSVNDYTNEYNEKNNKTLPLQDGWYHFADQQGVSVEIPRNCIKVGYCGTKNPVTVGLDGNACLPMDNGGELSAELCVGEMLGSVDMCCARPVGFITIRRCSNRRFLYNVTLNRRLVSEMDDFGICTKKLDETVPNSYLFKEPDSPKPETDHKKGIPIKEDTDNKREGSVVTVYIKRPTQQNTLTECDRWRWFKQFDSPFRERLASELTKQNRTSSRPTVTTTPPPTQDKEMDIEDMEGADAIVLERDHIPDIDPEGVGKPPFPFNLRKKRKRRSSDASSSSQPEASKPIVYTKDDIVYTTAPVYDGDTVVVTVVAAKKGDEVPSGETVLAAKNLQEDSSNETIVGVPILDAHEGYSDNRDSGLWESTVWRRYRALLIAIIVLVVLVMLVLLLLLLVYFLLRRRSSHRHQSYAVSEDKRPIRADDPKSETPTGITNPAAELTPVNEKPLTSLGEPSTFTSPPSAPQSQSQQEPPARQQPAQQQQASPPPPPPPPASSSPNDKKPQKLFGLRLPWSHDDKKQVDGGQAEPKKPTSPPPLAPLAVAYNDNTESPAGDGSTLPADRQLKPPAKIEKEKAPSPTSKKQSSLVLPWDNWKLGGGDSDKKNKDKDNGWIVPLEDMPRQSPPPSPQPPPPQLPPPPPPPPQPAAV